MSKKRSDSEVLGEAIAALSASIDELRGLGNAMRSLGLSEGARTLGFEANALVHVNNDLRGLEKSARRREARAIKKEDK